MIKIKQLMLWILQIERLRSCHSMQTKINLNNKWIKKRWLDQTMSKTFNKVQSQTLKYKVQMMLRSTDLITIISQIKITCLIYKTCFPVLSGDGMDHSEIIRYKDHHLALWMKSSILFHLRRHRQRIKSKILLTSYRFQSRLKPNNFSEVFQWIVQSC
jgi:hypothetical protein